MLDLTQPMMIEGKPDSRVIIEPAKVGKPGAYPIRVYSNGMSCMAYIDPNGEVVSTIYAGEKVINRSTHETNQIERAAMETSPLWGAF